MNSRYLKNILFFIRQTNLGVCLTVFIVSIVIYGTSVTNQFQMDWDDQWIVFNAYTSSGFSFNNIYKIFTEPYAGQYAPINQLYYTLLYTLDGYNPFLFHCCSFILHVANIVLMYFFIKRLLMLTRYFDSGSIARIAFYMSFLMSIHPLLVESVAWVAASKVVIYVFFYLIALHFYLNYINHRKFSDYLLVLFFFACSFACKEQAVSLQLCLVLLDYVLKRKLSSRYIWMEKAPFFILSLVFGGITIWSQQSAGTGLLVDRPVYPFYQNIAFAAYSLWQYLVKCFIPYPLSYLYPFPIEIGQKLPVKFWLPFLNLLIGCIYFRRFFKLPWVFFGIMFFLIHLCVVLHIIPISRMTIIADRYVYLGAVGIFFVAACLIDRIFISGMKSLKYIRLLLIMYCIGLITYSVVRTQAWYDSETLKMDFNKMIRDR